MRAFGWITAMGYVGLVAVLTITAFSRADQGFTVAEGIAIILTLPTMLVALPVVYVVGAALWNATDAGDGGGPMWPVTVGFTLMFAVAAAVNVGLFWLAIGWFPRLSARSTSQLP